MPTCYDEMLRAPTHISDAEGEWTAPLRWARGGDTGQLLTADAAGHLFSFDENKTFHLLGRAHLAPVGPMAMIPDP